MEQLVHMLEHVDVCEIRKVEQAIVVNLTQHNGFTATILYCNSSRYFMLYSKEL